MTLKEDPHFDEIVNELKDIQLTVDSVVFGSVFLRLPKDLLEDRGNNASYEDQIEEYLRDLDELAKALHALKPNSSEKEKLEKRMCPGSVGVETFLVLNCTKKSTSYRTQRTHYKKAPSIWRGLPGEWSITMNLCQSSRGMAEEANKVLEHHKNCTNMRRELENKLEQLQ
ncbi:hypothetical protein DdX_12117 [Ditylenchus destructor]|uniref:Uncharacterized protein n=1 Tax=Ditylenchus destructor TaxID=166010 RepID=A0AAD4R3P2_9BILA|nr:hypothetical protein DdX_12117 [Ditylenchus destructor]